MTKHLLSTAIFISGFVLWVKILIAVPHRVNLVSVFLYYHPAVPCFRKLYLIFWNTTKSLLLIKEIIPYLQNNYVQRQMIT